MTYLALLPALFGAFTLSANSPYSLAGSQSSINPQDNSTALPLPKPGQSVLDFLNMYFPDDDDDDADVGQGEETQPDLTKRNYTSSKGIVTSKWINDTGTVEQDYEIDLDLSLCESGLNFSTEAGVFTNSSGPSVFPRARCFRLY